MADTMPADAAQVANGEVHLNDWVRELPANHFQPCNCCLCMPPQGERPARQVRGIVQRDGRTFLVVSDLGHIDPSELERVPPPLRHR